MHINSMLILFLCVRTEIELFRTKIFAVLVLRKKKSPTCKHLVYLLKKKGLRCISHTSKLRSGSSAMYFHQPSSKPSAGSHCKRYVPGTIGCVVTTVSLLVATLQSGTTGYVTVAGMSGMTGYLIVFATTTGSLRLISRVGSESSNCSSLFLDSVHPMTILVSRYRPRGVKHCKPKV